MRKLASVLLSLVGLAGCSPGTDVPIAQRAIASFHSDLNAGSFEKIYANSDPELKSATNRDEFIKILGVVHSKLGPFTSGKMLNWNDNATTGGHYVTLNYQASYQKGSAEENFVYRLNGGGASLVGYHINSNTLLFS